MTTPVPARAHANMSVTERELTFDSLLAEFGELEEVQVPAAEFVPPAASAPAADSLPAAFEMRSTPVPDAAAPKPVIAGTPRAAGPTWAARSRALLSRLRAASSPEVLKLGGLIVVAALSLTLVFVALSR
ncbi:hypothetical protein QCD70_13960 [Agreia sp. PsM10]|uniref:hypothetical protein n=1 Tax=Agreia sp. PsM10 TaxID=3030533 RepID=UPI00263BA6C1|nr:hypothetical protein [Agreia sp. PsM10]MDN4641358.1 hypothetical protein [Agreia sp. PsM10]